MVHICTYYFLLTNQFCYIIFRVNKILLNTTIYNILYNYQLVPITIRVFCSYTVKVVHFIYQTHTHKLGIGPFNKTTKPHLQAKHNTSQLVFHCVMHTVTLHYIL